jgi:uncharacterized DUF497 family protein
MVLSSEARNDLLLGVHLINGDRLRPGEARSHAPATRLDFARAGELFAGETATIVDDRVVVTVWTQRGEARHIISMRHCHAKEEEIWRRRMERSR